jgi:hypothetical protein
VPVYSGRFRIVQRDVVLEDIRRQVEVGAEHITFGDPDFFNGIRHAIDLVQALHLTYPQLTYDVTIKVEHLLKHQEYLSLLRQTECAFATTAVESVDDKVLQILDKDHSQADFFRVTEITRKAELPLVPTFVAFTPWLVLEDYRDLLWTLANAELVNQVPPVQLSIRLLIPEGSRLLELPQVQSIVGTFDEASLSYRWRHPDSRVDSLQKEIEEIVRAGSNLGKDRKNIFLEAWDMVHRYLELPAPFLSTQPRTTPDVLPPYLSESWYCCAEPTDEQLSSF